MKAHAYGYPETACEVAIDPGSRDCPICLHVLERCEAPAPGGGAVGFLVVERDGVTEIRRVAQWYREGVGLSVACERVDEAEVVRELNDRHVLFVEGARL